MRDDNRDLTGLTRYDLARQLRIVCGTSPYPHLLTRRLGFARERMHEENRLVDIAFDAGVAIRRTRIRGRGRR